jgi:hypothetical protein
LNRHPWHQRIIGAQKTETRPQPQRRDHQRTCTIGDYIVTYGKARTNGTRIFVA